jgi:hypothetical protein
MTVRIGALFLSDAQLTSGETKRASFVAVHFGELALGETFLAVLRFHGASAQHQMREIEIEGVRRHVRALGHEAHVAQRAGFDDLAEILRLHAFDGFVRV